MMISKELISEVLNVNVLCIKSTEPHKERFYSYNNGYYGFSDATIIYSIKDNCPECNPNGNYYLINIYELAHKCKEWALAYGYEINSCLVIKIDNPKDFYATALVVHPTITTRFDANALSEPEAIFKACQWILDNKDKQ